MEQIILHSDDVNCCYALVEHLHHPEPDVRLLAAGGSPESRHGYTGIIDGRGSHLFYQDKNMWFAEGRAGA